MNNKKGVALLTVVLFVFTLSLMGITFLAMINTDLREVDSQYQDQQAFYLAEAGVQKALWYLNRGEAPPTTSQLLTIDNPPQEVGSYTMTVSGVEPVNISSTGTVKTGSAKIEVSIQAQDNPETPFPDYSPLGGTWTQRYVR